MKVGTFLKNLQERIVALESLVGVGISDPQRLKSTRESNLQVQTTLLGIGRISDVCPALQTYRVEAGSLGVLMCPAMSFSGGQLRVVPGYSVDDIVIVIATRGSGVGVIIGRVPPTSMYGNGDSRSIISLSDSFMTDSFFTSYIDTLGSDEEHDIPAWTPNGLIDETGVGEFFIGSPAGSKFFVDPFMCYLATNDATGVWAFRDDSMLRIAGINLQQITSGSYYEHLNDSGECTEIRGQCLYPWESMGYFHKPTTDIIQSNASWNKEKERSFFYEPVEQDAKPFYRVLGLGGWVGQGTSTNIIAPSADHGVSKYGQKEDTQQLLSRIAQNIDGLVTIESTKGVSIVKHSYIPAPQRLYDPSDESEGDTTANYDFEHKDVHVKGEPDYQVSDTNKAMQSVMAVDDYRAYTTNYKPFVGIVGHKKDWFVPEIEPQSESGIKQSITSSSSKELMDPPEPYKLKIHGDDEQQYYPVEAGLHFLPDGGVVLHDGYGSELRMSGGQITISAPLGVWIRSGKDVRIWSGNDTTVRANNAIEMSSTSGSVRIKAEKHLEMLGGNDGQSSGVIIESRGSGTIDFSKGGDGDKIGGILLKAPDGVVSTIGSTIYTKVNNSGSIMLDADGGNGTIYSCSDVQVNYVKSEHAIAFGDFKNKNIKTVQSSTESAITIPGSIRCAGGAEFAGDLTVDGSIRGGAHISTKDGSDNPFVSGIDGKARTAFDNQIRELKKELGEKIPNRLSDVRDTVEERFYGKFQPGNNDVITQSGFSFRTDDELALDDFKVYADRWQTICVTGNSTWKETKVTTKTGKGEYPFPGQKYFENVDCYVTQGLSLYDDEKPKKRMNGDSVAEEYSEPKYKQPEVKSLNDYPIL